MTNNLIFRSDEASKGAFQGIKRIEGILVPPKRVASKFAETTTEEGRTIIPKDQVEVVLEDAIILEMDEGEVEPELRDGKFTFWMNYAPPGKPKPHQNTFYIKGFTKSAEAICEAQGIPSKLPDGLNNPDYGVTHFFDTRVTLERRRILLFPRPIEGSDKKEEITQEGFVFVEATEGAGVNVDAHIKYLVIGLNKQAALRNLLMDNRAKRSPEYKDALANDTLADKLGVTIVDGIFREQETREVADESNQ